MEQGDVEVSNLHVKSDSGSTGEQLRTELLNAISVRNKQIVSEICDQCLSEETLLKLLDVVEGCDEEAMECAVMVAYHFSLRNCPSVRAKVKAVCSKLVNFPRSRLVRKIAISSLKSSIENSDSAFWTNYFILLSALEEPQFHLIEPVLPKFDTLLNECSSQSWSGKVIYSDWVEILFAKALSHSNGWIRNWALEKIVSIDSKKCSFHLSFLVDVLFPILRSHDSYWRLLEKEHLEAFLDQFFNFLQNILCSAESSQLEEFFEKTLALFTVPWNPGPLFFFSLCLKKLCSKILFQQRDLLILKGILNVVNNVQFRILRIATALNFVSFFVKNISWDSVLIWRFTPILVLLRHLEKDTEGFGIIKCVIEEILEVWIKSGSSCGAEPESIVSQFLEHVDKDGSKDNYISCAEAAWTIARRYVLIPELLERILVLLSKMPCDKEMENLVFLLLSAPEESFREICPSSFSQLKNLVFEFWKNILLRPNTDAFWSKFNELFSCEVISNLFKDWLIETQTLFPEGDMGFYHQALSFASLNVSSSICAESAVVQDALKAIAIDQLFDSVKHFASKKCHSKAERLGQLRFFLLNTHCWESEVDEILKCILEVLNQTSVWEEKSLLLDLCALLVKRSRNFELFYEVTNVVTAALREEKNSRNYLKAVKLLLKIVVQKNLLIREPFKETVLKILADLLVCAASHVQIAFLISDALLQVCKYLDADWVPVILNLCTFGPILSKDAKVLCAASSYSCDMLAQSSFLRRRPRAEEMQNVVKYARLESLLVAGKMCADNVNCVCLFVNGVFGLFEQFDKLPNKSFGLSLAHRQKTRLLQVLLLLTKFLDESSLRITYNRCLGYVTDASQQYSIKLLVEWIIVTLTNRCEALFHDFVKNEHKFAKKRVGSITSWINVLMHSAKLDVNESKLRLCFRLFLPWCTAQNFSIRCSAIAALRGIWDIAPPKLRVEFNHIEGILSFDAEPAGNGKRIVDILSNDFYYAVFHAERNRNLEVVYDIFPWKTGLPDEECISPDIIRDVLSTENSPFTLLETNNALRASPSLIFSSLAKQSNPQVLLSSAVEEENCEQEDMGVQRKFDVLRGKWRRPQGKSFIVVASLVDKATNLGGLCRTCEVFGVEKFILADFSVLKDQNFRALSMSSEKWIDMEQVRSAELFDYLEARRNDGYAIIAAEQSTNSVNFYDFTFPPKALLLLGDEKEGIPVQLIRFVDTTVEISQYGQTRSLNVHVTGALFIQKYAQNHYIEY